MKSQERFDTVERAIEGNTPPHPEVINTQRRDSIPSPHNSFRDEEAFKQLIARHIPKYRASQELIQEIKKHITDT